MIVHCLLHWQCVRHLEDGSVNYIEGTLLIVIYDIFLSLLFLLLSQNLRLKLFILTGAKQPNYLITADDVDTYLAIEVQPLDDRKRKVLILSRIIDSSLHFPICCMFYASVYI